LGEFLVSTNLKRIKKRYGKRREGEKTEVEKKEKERKRKAKEQNKFITS